MKTTKVCLGFPWYNGPDKSTYTTYFEIMHYFGRMQERSHWLQQQVITGGEYDIPTLDPMKADGEHTEITAEDGIFEFGYSDEGGLSLPGLARERVVENAMAWGADWLFMWDYDMLMPWSAFLRLWRHQKPVVGALAFTARNPIQPVIYRIKEKHGLKGLEWHSETVFDYPRDQLITDIDVGGPIAFGAGCVLFNMNVFKQIGKPWFHSTACGEDWMFCVRCWQSGVPRYVDTSLKTVHKVFKPQWHGEAEYDANRKAQPEEYARMIAEGM